MDFEAPDNDNFAEEVDSVSVTVQNGLLAKTVVSSVPSEDSWFETARFEFKYTDTEITPARYAQMINSFLMGTENSYYKYNWY